MQPRSMPAARNGDAPFAGARHGRGARAPAAGSAAARTLSAAPGHACPRAWRSWPTPSSAQGVVQPIVVRPIGEPDERGVQRYEIIAGERRWRAAQLAGLRDIPAVIRRVPDEAAIAMALIENIQRENLNPLEEARALERLISEFGLTHQQAADAVGRSRAAVSNLLRLLELPDGGMRTAGQARAGDGARARVAGPAAAAAADRGCDAGGAQEPVGARNRGAGAPHEPAGARARTGAAECAVDPNIRRLQDDLSEKLGAAVAIEHGDERQGPAGREVQQPRRAGRNFEPYCLTIHGFRAWGRGR
jgi:ParB family chromosome partitioning protein